MDANSLLVNPPGLTDDGGRAVVCRIGGGGVVVDPSVGLALCSNGDVGQSEVDESCPVMLVGWLECAVSGEENMGEKEQALTINVLSGLQSYAMK